MNLMTNKHLEKENLYENIIGNLRQLRSFIETVYNDGYIFFA